MADSSRQNATRLTWDKVPHLQLGTNGCHDEDEEDDARLARPLRTIAKNKSLRPAFVGQWFDAVRGFIARLVNEV
ncbi:hypothetical protein EOW77_0002145 [Bradyrhizobium yuanmingense]|uniref:hypothetical protein n=1 Tax=Bradyrhizobium yuanmingense TaxID=108015 RepID=UPI000FE2EF03|nr:hypothetical protein [Bradyrhizobium yuanmingense]TGN90662.1 hypothetical protein EOW77_0002145 [Bradyrhizobium yuanmingense]